MEIFLFFLGNVFLVRNVSMGNVSREYASMEHISRELVSIKHYNEPIVLGCFNVV